MPLRYGIAVLAACAALSSGCGGDGASASGSGSGAGRPVIPAAIAATLAGQADAVAAAARRGDGCAAAAAARRLQDGVAAAVAAGRIPSRLAAPLRSSVVTLTASITCAPPAKPAPHKGPGHHGHGKKHDKRHGGKGD